jgi:RimJ/RimL family protein N-acetyltransferase
MTNTVSLRPLTVNDIDDIMAWVNDPDVTKNFAAVGKQISREDELRWLETTLADPNERLFAIELDGRYIGNAGIHKIYWPAKNGRLGIVIGDRNVHGRGVGTEALRQLCAVGFSDLLGLHKLWLMHYMSNQRMAHIAQKLGFVSEGVLRDEYFHRGDWHDMVRWSLLQGEFSEREPTVNRGPATS